MNDAAADRHRYNAYARHRVTDLGTRYEVTVAHQRVVVVASLEEANAIVDAAFAADTARERKVIAALEQQPDARACDYAAVAAECGEPVEFVEQCGRWDGRFYSA